MTALGVISNKKGFTLIELLVAVVFIALSMLAMLSVMQTSIRTNADNEVRGTAVRLTNQTAETLGSLQWASAGGLDRMDPELSAGVHTRVDGDNTQNAKGFPSLWQNLRSTQQEYQIQWSVDDTSANSKRITITVSYTPRNRLPLSNTTVIFKKKTII